MAAPRLRRLSFLLLFCLLTALFLPAALAAGPSGGRLYVLTPKVPQAACYLVDEVRQFYASLGENSLELFSSASAFAWDGDLNGTRIATDGGYLIENASGPEAYGLTYHSKGAATTTGQPFSFYDSAGKPSGQYLYAKKVINNAVVTTGSGLGSAKEYAGEYGPSISCNDLLPDRMQGTDGSWINRLALHPAISKENPLVLYETEAGLGGVTLDGTEAFCLILYPGGCSEEEVRLLALALHGKRTKKVLATEEIVCANAPIAPEKLCYWTGWTFSPLTKAGSDRANRMAAEQGYGGFGTFAFQKATSPTGSEALYYGTQARKTELGAYRLEAVVRTDRTDLHFVLPGGGEGSVSAKTDTLKTVEERVRQKQTAAILTARMNALLPPEKDGALPAAQAKATARDLTGSLYTDEVFEELPQWKKADCYALYRPAAELSYRSRDKNGKSYLSQWWGETTFYAIAHLPEGTSPRDAEIAWFVRLIPFGNDPEHSVITLRAKEGETYASLLNRLREALP